MKFNKNIFIAFALVLMTSCELNNNINPKEVTSVPINDLFANAQVDLFNQVDQADVHWNISRFLAQYWAESTYASASNYDFDVFHTTDNFQIQLYREVLRDLKEATNLALAQDLSGYFAIERNNQVAIMDVLEVYAWHLLVDGFGDVPYSEALDAQSFAKPVYDDAATIYNDIINILTTAIRNIDESGSSFGSADLVYGGDMTMWKKFGASLLFRLGMRLADVNEPVSRQAVSDALSFGVFEVGEEGALYYTGAFPYVNSIYYQFKVHGFRWFIPANTIVDKMNELDDPRRILWFTKNEVMLYAGGTYGATNGVWRISNFTDQFYEPTLPARLIDFTEVSFLLAEAVERGFDVPGTAEAHYNNGIRESILQWGGSMVDVNTYLANPDVAYNTAQGNWKQKIGTQKWIALYNRGLEGWAEWRRLDFPILNTPEQNGGSYDDLPRRMPYPPAEYKLNGENVKTAVEKLGGDYHWLRVFWDVY